MGGQKMVKTTVEATEMLDAQATFISLVGAGANRAAFKTMKDGEGGKPVLNFGKLFVDKLDAAHEGISGERSVLAVLVDKAANLDKAKEVLKGAGFNVENQVDAEGAYVFLQQEGANLTGDRTGIYKANAVFGAIVEMEKAFQPFPGTTSFTENLNAQGFFPSLRLAQEVLHETAHSAMADAPDRAAAVDSIQKAGEEFAAHLTDITRRLPEEVFKLDALSVEKQESSFQDPNAANRAKEPSPNDPNASGREDPVAGEATPAQGPNAVAKVGDEGEEKKGKGKPFGGKQAKPFGKKKVDVVGVARDRGINLAGIDRVEVQQEGLLFVAKVDAGGGTGGGVNIFVRFDTMDGMPPSPEVANMAASEAEFRSGDGVDRGTNVSVDAPTNSSLPGVAKSDEPKAAEPKELTGAEAQAALDAGIFGARFEEALSPVLKAIEAVGARVGAVEKAAEQAQADVATVAEQVGGTVLAHALDDPDLFVEKSEDVGGPPLMDSGMDAKAREFQRAVN